MDQTPFREMNLSMAYIKPLNTQYNMQAQKQPQAWFAFRDTFLIAFTTQFNILYLPFIPQVFYFS